jgi:hypothetical protein
MTGNPGGPMTLVKLGSHRFHDRGRRQASGATAYAQPASPRPGTHRVLHPCSSALQPSG